MVNVGGRSFDGTHKTPCLYDEYGHPGVMAEAQGFELNKFMFIYHSVNMKYMEKRN